MAKFAWGRWRLLLYLGCIIWFPKFVLIWILLSSTNKSKENLYCDLSGKIFNSLNKLLKESLLLHPIIILIAPIWHLNNCGTMGRVLPKYNTISHNRVKKRIINHYQCRMGHEWFNGMNYIGSSVQLIYKLFNTISPR